MKTNLIVTAIAILIIGSLMFSTFTFKEKYQVQKSENEILKAELTDLNVTYSQLASAFFELSKKKTYSISLAPNINSKINSTFGSAKNLTFQYYFTMDGNKLEILPDSTFVLKK